VKGTKTQTSKKEGKESKNPDTTGSMRGDRENFGVPGGESAKERNMMARRRRKKVSPCGMDVAK
jgi:hypothetical protein